MTSFSDRLDQQRAQLRAGHEFSNANAARNDQSRINFFLPICELVGQMHAADVRFPAGRPPTRDHVLNTVALSTIGPRISISIDSRRQIILETTVRAGGVLQYAAYIWEISHATDVLNTDSVSKVSDWLARQVSQFEYVRSGSSTERARPRRPILPPVAARPTALPPTESAADNATDVGPEERERIIDLR